MNLGLKILSEKLSTSIKENNDNIVTKYYGIDQTNENLALYYNKMKSIKEQVEDIKSQWKSLQEDVECFSFAKTVYYGNSIRESFQKAIDDLKIEFEDAKSNYNFYKNLKNKTLNESENGSEDNIIPPSNLSNSNTNYIIDELSSMFDSYESTKTILQYLFDELVPENGKSNTIAGELVRSIMDLLYNSKANNYKFYESEGLNRCGGSAQYLIDNGYEDNFAPILTNIYDLNSTIYNEYLETIASEIIEDIYNNPKLLTTKNTIDSRQYNYQNIIDISPVKSYIVEIPSNITDDYSDYFNAYDVLRHIKDIFDNDNFTNYIIEDIFNPKTNEIEITNITGKDLEYLKGLFEDSKFWDDYYIELTSNLEENLQIIHDTLNEDKNDNDNHLVNLFMEYHEDYNNYENNPEGYDAVYKILDQYGSEDEDVDKLFSMASEDEQKEMINLIRPKDEYSN